MPRGGRRPGSGRKKGSRNKKVYKAVADAIAASGRTPLAYMLQVMEDVTVDPVRRDDMAKAAAVYCHPKLSSITTNNTSTNVNHNSETQHIQILAVPRGARIEKDGTALTIDGEACELKSIEPFVGTPALSDLRDHSGDYKRVEPERASFEVREAEVPENVTRMDTFKNKRDNDDDSDDGGAPGAA